MFVLWTLSFAYNGSSQFLQYRQKTFHFIDENVDFDCCEIND